MSGMYPFRRGIVKEPSAKRVQKVCCKSINSFCPVSPWFLLPLSPFSCITSFRLVFGSVIGKFFAPLYLRKIKLIRWPVKHVDHELDEKVPFRADTVKCYMDFINIWIRPLNMLLHRYGWLQGSRHCAEVMRYLIKTYTYALKIYRHCMTTTYRTPCDQKQVKKLRAADPHYCCVPSLHISIVCLCFSFYKMLFDRENFTFMEKQRWNWELYSRAVEIGETVLYLKQHSVNCIPAALYMLTRLAPELFTPSDAVRFVNDLFQKAEDVTEKDKGEIRSHIIFMYERFLLEGTTEDDWTLPITRWLDAYDAYTPSYAK